MAEKKEVETTQENKEEIVKESRTSVKDNADVKLDNSIFIGEKPFMNYITAVVMQFRTKGAEEVIIKARGKFISRAVDVAEVASKRFLEGTVKVDKISVDSEEFKNKEGKDVRVSSIELILVKN